MHDIILLQLFPTQAKKGMSVKAAREEPESKIFWRENLNTIPVCMYVCMYTYVRTSVWLTI